MSDPLLTGRTMSPEGERAKGLLKLANYTRVAEVLGVSRASVSRWAKGQQVTPWQLQRLQELLGRNDESAPPEWARRMAIRLRAHSAKLEVSDEEMARAAIEEAADWAVAGDDEAPPQQPRGAASGQASV